MGSNATEQVLPSKDSTLPFWRTELHKLDTYRSTPDLPRSCDVLIIGAGYAGITSAYHLLESYEGKGSRPNVVLLEARQACSGATGRNGGHLRPAVFHSLPGYVKEYGAEAAAEVAVFEDAHVQAIADLVKKEKIDCDFTLTKTFDVFTDAEKAKAAKKAYDEMKSQGVAKSTLDGITFTGPDRAEVECGVKGAVACFSWQAAHLWPYKLMLHLLSIAVSKGLHLQTLTPVTSLASDSGKWTATTERGTITAAKVIVATNGYTSGILPEYAGKIVPAKGICSRIVVPAGSKHPQLASSYGLRLPGLALDYLIPRNDGSIIVGGARNRFRKNREQWHGVTDDSTLIQGAEDYFDGYMQRNFVGWEESGAVVDKVWTGIMGYDTDSLPNVGEVPGRNGCFIAAGFDGHGMPVIFLTAKGVAKMVAEGVDFEDTGIPIIYKTTKARLESDRDDMAPEVAVVPADK